MKKTNKVNPITFFREADEARQKLVKKSMGGPAAGAQGTFTINSPGQDRQSGSTYGDSAQAKKGGSVKRKK
jgi:hypothetical protein